MIGDVKGEYTSSLLFVSSAYGIGVPSALNAIPGRWVMEASVSVTMGAGVVAPASSPCCCLGPGVRDDVAGEFLNSTDSVTECEDKDAMDEDDWDPTEIFDPEWFPEPLEPLEAPRERPFGCCWFGITIILAGRRV